MIVSKDLSPIPYPHSRVVHVENNIYLFLKIKICLAKNNVLKFGFIFLN
jgi:hypothetical protein